MLIVTLAAALVITAWFVHDTQQWLERLSYRRHFED